MRVRSVKPDDQNSWLRMRKELWPESENEHLSAISDYFSGLSKFVDQAFVCEDDQATILGFIELRIRNYAEGSEHTRVPYVEGWFVDASTRERGVGSRLVAAAESWALEKGFSELASDAEIENDVSISAHLALGFSEVERSVSFLKKL